MTPKAKTFRRARVGGSAGKKGGGEYSVFDGIRSRFWRGDTVQTPDGKTGTVQAVFEDRDGKVQVTIGSLSSEAPGTEYNEKNLGPGKPTGERGE